MHEDKGTRERPTRTAALGHRLAVLAQLSAAKYYHSTQRWPRHIVGGGLRELGWEYLFDQNIRINLKFNIVLAKSREFKTIQMQMYLVGWLEAAIAG